VSNRLSGETSPYLLQHAENPVDWYPWGEEALSRARMEDRPILLSIGYSACHWCHVMAHESFENPSIAALMNDLFVNIKVDREERPDLDAIYMQAVQAISGQGGWPMTVFLTPDGTPFYGGTYYPPEDYGGRPGFPRLLQAIAEAYQSRRADVERSGRDLVEQIRQAEKVSGSRASIDREVLDSAFGALAGQFDAVNGGFGNAPKFPQPMAVEFLERTYHRTGERRALTMIESTLDHMAAGGIYDHLGGGFHRYSTDGRWQIPHFEKMLYDNAQLTRVYLAAFQITGKIAYRRIAEETLDYVLREMIGSEGGFYSTQDADSEGKEGKFFAWSRREVLDILGPDLALPFCLRFGVDDDGNFEGENVLHIAMSIEDVAQTIGVSHDETLRLIEEGRSRLFFAREERVHPGLDDKVITSWNGLMLRAVAEASRVLDRSDYLAVANRSGRFLFEQMWVPSRRLLRTWRDGRGKGDAYLEDYACLLNGVLSLYEATFAPDWFVWAEDLAAVMIDQFGEDGVDGFFDTGREHESLVVRPREFFDNAMPSGNSAAAEALLRLAAFTENQEYKRRGDSVIRPLLATAARYPTGFGNLLCAADFAVSQPKQITIVGRSDKVGTGALLQEIFRPYIPNKVVAGAEPGDLVSEKTVPLLQGRIEAPDVPLVYVCENFVCQRPSRDPESLRDLLVSEPA
jgi:uncharacterized protein YyaL (SSP411 family)